MGKSAPKAPDPYQTAAAQSGMNRDTAISQQMLNMTGQFGPTGSTTYQQDGWITLTDAQGKQYQIPKMNQYTKLSENQQGIFDATEAAQGNIANLAKQQSAALGQSLSTPFSYNNQDAENWAYDLASPRILEQQKQNQQALESRLVNSGIRPGTTAWDREMARMTNANTDQMNQLALTGREQAFNEQLAGRNQNVNELSALMSGGQVGNPNAMYGGATPQAQVAGVDYTGLVNNNYNQQMQQYNAKMGGLSGTLGAGAQMALMASDARLKEDVQKVGKLDNGLNVYLYRYKSGGPYHIGVMAQEVENINPSAVHEIEGFLAVDYQEAVL